MNTSTYYRSLVEVEDRVSAKMAAVRKAELDVAPYVDIAREDIACDSAEGIYQGALRALGIPEIETKGIPLAGLRVLLKNVRSSPAAHGASAMAMDANEGSSALSAILNGIEAPRDISTRSDRLR
jgi:hypothetical protein